MNPQVEFTEFLHQLSNIIYEFVLVYMAFYDDPTLKWCCWSVHSIKVVGSLVDKYYREILCRSLDQNFYNSVRKLTEII